MKSMISMTIALLLAVASLTSCESGKESEVKYYWNEVDITGDGSIKHIQTSGNTIVNYTHELGSSAKDLYLILTNVSAYDAPLTKVSLSEENRRESLRLPEFKSAVGQEPSLVDGRGAGLKGTLEISEFNSGLPGIKLTRMSGNERRSLYSRRTSSVGEKNDFIYDGDGNTVRATLQKVVTVAPVTLSVWVSDESSADSNGQCAKSYCVTKTMVEEFANKFLKTGSDNDIYDWVSNIFGEPWGTHNFHELIGYEASQNIDILFYDIDSDNSSNGGVLGFFWSKDNIKKIHYSTSNERLMFYIDSVMSAVPSCEALENPPCSWEISDYWPSIMASTLVHEFQHMIHFYQKQIKDRNAFQSSEIWINEMSSMAAEDLLATKILSDGPRGVPYGNGTAGETDNSKGRLPRYNAYNYKGVSYWYQGEEALDSYALNYALGAYLARNYGGAGFFRKVVQSGHADYRAIDEALKESGHGDETFQTVLAKWGAAVVLSNTINAPAKYRYNKGGYFDSVVDGVTYRLGSINLFNYSYGYGSQNGPKFFTAEVPFSVMRGHFKTSNTYVKWGRFSGSASIKAELPYNVLMTVVAKDSP